MLLCDITPAPPSYTGVSGLVKDDEPMRQNHLNSTGEFNRNSVEFRIKASNLLGLASF
jgi:hypothetical protein